MFQQKQYTIVSSQFNRHFFPIPSFSVTPFHFLIKQQIASYGTVYSQILKVPLKVDSYTQPGSLKSNRKEKDPQQQ